MKQTIIYSIFIVMLLLFPLLLGHSASMENQLNSTENIAEYDEGDVPIWEIGDSWTYDILYQETFDQHTYFDWQLDDVVFTVTDILNLHYSLFFEGNLTGKIGQFPVPMILEDATIQGNLLIDKANLALSECTAHVHGIRHIGPIEIPVDIDITITATPGFTHLSFPLTVGNSWYTPSSFISIEIILSINDDPHPHSYQHAFSTGELPMICENKQTIIVDAGSYEAFKITDIMGVHETYFSIVAGNIVKLSVHNHSAMRYIEMELVSTTYDAAGSPMKPSTPSGPTSGDIDTPYTYCTSTIDPENDPIYYLWDWDDGTTSGWIGPFDSDAPMCIEHTWDEEGFYEVKVKAKDIHELESPWSDPLEVTIGTVQDTTPPSVEITKPEEYGIYYYNVKIGTFPFATIVIGYVDVIVSASDDESGMDYVEFYVDDVLKETVTTPPYTYHFDEPPGTHLIAATAYDTAGNSAEDTILVWRVL